MNRHDDRIRAFALASEQAIPYSAFEMFLDLVRSMHGPKLLRVKGGIHRILDNVLIGVHLSATDHDRVLRECRAGERESCPERCRAEKPDCPTCHLKLLVHFPA